MQEEIEQKSFNIMISTTKLSARTVLRAVKAAFRLYQSKASQGKQSVRTLLRQNRGVSSVEISKTGIRGLERYAKKYGIDYAIRKDTSEVPPRYLVFFKAPDAEALRAKQLSTCERIAAQNGVGAATVKRAEKYAKGVDAAEDAVPGAREEILTGRIKATDAEITALAKTPKAEIPAALAELRKPKQERQPRKAETASSKQTLSEISKSIQGHQRQLTAEEKTSLKASIDNRYQERAVANGSLMMCEVQGAKEDFIRRWNSIFKEYPDVFEDSDCRKIIHDLTEDAVQYLLKIKEKTL